MKHFRDENDNLFAFEEDGSQDHLILDSYTAINDSELAEIVASKLPQVNSDQAKNMIDVAAGNARARFIAQGWEVVEEYRLAQREVEAWREAGSPSNDVPASITTWATAEGMTDEQAAQGVEAAAVNFETLLLNIRGLRLAGKAAVDNASDNFMTAAQPFIDQLDAIQP